MIKVINVVNECQGVNVDEVTEIISAGDLSTHTIQIEESISHNTAEYPVGNSNYYVATFVTPTTTTFKFNAYYLMSSFRVGQEIEIVKTHFGSGSGTYTRTIVAVDYNEFTIKVLTTGATFNPLYGNLGYSPTQDNIHIYCELGHTNFLLNVGLNDRQYPYLSNKIASLTKGTFQTYTDENRKSLIDDTITRLHCPVNLQSIAETDVENLELVSVKSGIGKVTATIERLTDVNDYTRLWEITLNVVNCIQLLDEGILGDTQQVFDNTLILYTDYEFHTGDVNPYPNIAIENPFVLQHDLRPIAFTNDPFGNPSTSQILPISPSFNNGVYYNAESETFIVTFGSFGGIYEDIYIGASYIPQRDSYFKNKDVYQTELSMIIQSDLAVTATTYASELNPDGAGYELEIISLTNPTATTYEIEFKIIPNEAFKTFFEDENNNKNFVVWGKFGHTCHVVYLGEALRKPKALIPFNDVAGTETGYVTMRLDDVAETYPIDASYDTTSLTPLSYPLFNTEDHFDVIYKLLVPKYKRYSNIKTELIFGLYTDIAESYIVLEENLIDVSNNILDFNDGSTLFNNSILNAYNLQTNVFNKTVVTSKAVGVLPTETHQPLSISTPFQFNWRYWLTQPQVYDFLIAQGLTTKNYISYVRNLNTNADINISYKFFIRTTVENEDDIYYHYTLVQDLFNYNQQFETTDTPAEDEEWQGSGIVKYYLSNGTEVPNLIIGEEIRVEVIVTTGIDATTDAWANLTIEKKESNIRWTISTNYNNIANVDSPLEPETGQTRLRRQLTGANEIKYSCIVDCAKLEDFANYKITLKHWNKYDGIKEQTRFKFDTVCQLQPFVVEDNNFNLDLDCNYDIQEVYGFLDDANNYEKNDTTLLLGYKITSTTVVTFKVIGYNGAEITISGSLIGTHTSDANAKFSYIDWNTILDEYGAGCYDAYIVLTDGESVKEILYGKYRLRPWDSELIVGTVKFRTYINSIITTNKVSEDKNYSYKMNFTNSKVLFDDYRVNGFFGNRKPKTDIRNIIDSQSGVLASFKENRNEYFFTSDPVYFVQSDYLLDFIFLNGLSYYIWDYNKFNHKLFSYKRITLNEVQDTEDFQFSNKVVVKATFVDYVQDNKMSY